MVKPNEMPVVIFNLQLKNTLNKFLFLIITFISGYCSSPLYGQTSSFTYQSSNGVFCSPSTINFTQTCTGNPIGFTWSFDNGQFSNAANPSITFAAGNYTVKLVAVFESEAVESSQTIVINPNITGTLTADRNYICTPGNVSFTATSSGNIATYEWNFGDASPVVTTNTPTINHGFSSFGTYNVTVKATDAAGCFVTSPTTITVQNPPISGSASPASGCIAANVSFIANVTVPSGGSVTNYLYNYGDGSPASSTATHTYAVVGSYTPSVSITTNEGCTNNFTYPTIAFGTPPSNHVAAPGKPVYCGSETSTFTSTAVNANSWFWDYGDGTTETTTTGAAQHKYLTLGPKTVKVTPYFNGCAGTMIQFTIDVVGVISQFTFANTCTAPRTFSFTNTTLGNQSIISWNFGDGSPTSSLSNPTHTFPVNGLFVTSLTITDNATGCTDVYSRAIYTASPTLTNVDVAVCRNSNTTFTLQNNYPNAGAAYTWNVAGLPAVTNSTASYTANATILGNFSNNFVVINNGAEYCLDTVTQLGNLLVKGPNLNYTMPASVCAKSNLTILNTSTAFVPADTVKLWYWNYGVIPTNDTIYQPQPVNYPGAGTYTVKLVAKDKAGCIDSLSKQIVVKAIPFLRVFPRNDTLCLGKTDSLFAYHSDSLLWSPAASLSCATCDTVIASPTVTTLYFAKANNTLNCPVFDSTLITVYQPIIASPVTNPVYVCLNDSVQINALPAGNRITWSPTTNISNATAYNPFVSPPINTTYTAALTDSVGCFSDTTFVDVIVKSLPNVNAGPDQILPYNTMFTLTPTYGSNIVSYEWSPAVSLTCATCPITNGTALQSQLYNIKVTSDSGCVARDAVNIFIECKYANLLMPSAFTPNKDGKNDIYYPLTRGIKMVKKMTVFNRYGQAVFERSNFLPNNQLLGWDGKYKGIDQNADTFVYILETVCELGEIISRKGSFLLLR
ncbi:MAG: PKD domain-containing protein [Ferruginibacter sp.]|nr:PKD domain-containing protein [Ferruginibacter sp.]